MLVYFFGRYKKKQKLMNNRLLYKFKFQHILYTFGLNYNLRNSTLTLLIIYNIASNKNLSKYVCMFLIRKNLKTTRRSPTFTRDSVEKNNIFYCSCKNKNNYNC